MTRDEYDELDLPEAQITFHDDPLMGEVYVTVEWYVPLPGMATSIMGEVRKGFKFIVAKEYVENMMHLRALPPRQCPHCGHTDGKHLPWCQEQRGPSLREKLVAWRKKLDEERTATQGLREFREDEPEAYGERMHWFDEMIRTLDHILSEDDGNP